MSRAQAGDGSEDFLVGLERHCAEVAVQALAPVPVLLLHYGGRAGPRVHPCQ